jgi:hypothetical protein
VQGFLNERPSPAGSVRIQLVAIANVAKGPSHLFHGLHVFQCRLHRLGCRVDRLESRLTGHFGGTACILGGRTRRLCHLTQLLSLMPDLVHGVAMLIPKLTGLLRKSPEALGLLTRRLVGRISGVNLAAVLLRTAAGALPCFPRTLSLFSILLRALATLFVLLTGAFRPCKVGA